MLKIDTQRVDELAPNANAIKNARKLLQQNKFYGFYISKDQTLIFGECEGSGDSVYECSVDFINEDEPISRCSCPSRQFPCKHCLGLMYAYANLERFVTEKIPEDVLRKRQKLLDRAKKRSENLSQPKNIDKEALKKKVEEQLAGLDHLEKLMHEMVRHGFGNLNFDTLIDLFNQSQRLKEAYLPGAHKLFLSCLNHFLRVDYGYYNRNAEDKEALYSSAIDHLSRVNSLIKHGRKYLSQQLKEPDLNPQRDGVIATLLGQVWQLRDLKTAGLIEGRVELAQLAYNSYPYMPYEETIGIGTWIHLKTGKLYSTQEMVPFNASNQMKMEGSQFQVQEIKELFIYPGDITPRVRWEESKKRDLKKKDLTKIRKFAQVNIVGGLNDIKNQMKAPLGDKNPVVLIQYKKIVSVEGKPALVDFKDQRLGLTDACDSGDPKTLIFLNYLPKQYFHNQVMVARLHFDIEKGSLHAKPLSIVGEDDIIRLTY